MIACILDYCVSVMVFDVTATITSEDKWLRIPGILALLIALVVLKPAVDLEQTKEFGMPVEIEELDKTYDSSFVDVNDTSFNNSTLKNGSTIGVRKSERLIPGLMKDEFEYAPI